MTPEGRSRVYPYIKISAQESLATPPGSTSPTLLEQRSESAMRQDVQVFSLL